MTASTPSLTSALIALCFGLGALHAQAPDPAAENAADPAAENADAVKTEQLKPMPKLPDSELGRVLERYYQRALGGYDNWARLNSLRVEGTVEIGEGTFDFMAYQKKPNLLKAIVKGPGGELISGHDGEVAWRSVPGSNPVEMDPAEARSFVHNANFDTFLLYPLAQGKTIEYRDVVPNAGRLCHQIRVTLDTGFTLDYFIDIHNFHLIRSVSTDLETGKVTENVFEDFTTMLNIPMAQKVTTYNDGELSSVVEVSALKPNVGIMPWMFRMPETVASPQLDIGSGIFDQTEGDPLDSIGFGN